MNKVNVLQAHVFNLGQKKYADRLRQAIARRRVQEMHDEKALQSWLKEVWHESA